MTAEKKIDLYGSDNSEAISDLLDISANGPDMEKAVALLTLSEILPVDSDSAMTLVMQAYSLSDSGDIATEIENRLNLPRGPGYQVRPSVILEKAWKMMETMKFNEAWTMLHPFLSLPWSRMIRPEMLWASYVAGEGARIEDGILESYLNELVQEYPETEFGEAARNRLGGEEDGGE